MLRGWPLSKLPLPRFPLLLWIIGKPIGFSPKQNAEGRKPSCIACEMTADTLNDREGKMPLTRYLAEQVSKLLQYRRGFFCELLLLITCCYEVLDNQAIIRIAKWTLSKSSKEITRHGYRNGVTKASSSSSSSSSSPSPFQPEANAKVGQEGDVRYTEDDQLWAPERPRLSKP